MSLAKHKHSYKLVKQVPFTISNQTNQYIGQISRISPQVDAATRQLTIYTRLNLLSVIVGFAQACMPQASLIMGLHKLGCWCRCQR